MTEAVDKFIVGRRAGGVIKANVLEELAEGHIPDVAAALKRAEKFAALADAGAGAAPANGGGNPDPKVPVTEGSDGGLGGAKPPVDGAANKLKALKGGRA